MTEPVLVLGVTLSVLFLLLSEPFRGVVGRRPGLAAAVFLPAALAVPVACFLLEARTWWADAACGLFLGIAMAGTHLRAAARTG